MSPEQLALIRRVNKNWSSSGVAYICSSQYHFCVVTVLLSHIEQQEKGLSRLKDRLIIRKAKDYKKSKRLKEIKNLCDNVIAQMDVQRHGILPCDDHDPQAELNDLINDGITTLLFEHVPWMINELEKIKWPGT
jgi:hypothetical protein